MHTHYSYFSLLLLQEAEIKLSPLQNVSVLFAEIRESLPLFSIFVILFANLMVCE